MVKSHYDIWCNPIDSCDNQVISMAKGNKATKSTGWQDRAYVD